MTNSSTTDLNLRVQPRIWIGLAIYVGYVSVVFAAQSLSGISYPALGENGANLFLGVGVSLIIGAILLAITTSLSGWWRPALFEQTRAHHRWPIIAAVLMVIALVFNLATTDWSSYDSAFFAASVVLILVGFTEELATRGLLLTALRARLAEVWVWFLTSALFGLMHLVNIATGQDLATTLQQVAFAFCGGTVFYIVRRVTGTLVWAMVLHGLWDFSTFAVGHGTPGPLAAVGGTINFIAMVFALVAVGFVIRGAGQRTDSQ